MTADQTVKKRRSGLMMTDESLSAEIELLRKQLDAMRNERESAVDHSKEPEPEAVPAEDQETSTSVDEIIDAVKNAEVDLSGHVRQFLDNVDNDLKDAKPSTLLMVFALGVLIGRLR